MSSLTTFALPMMMLVLSATATAAAERNSGHHHPTCPILTLHETQSYFPKFERSESFLGETLFSSDSHPIKMPHDVFLTLYISQGRIPKSPTTSSFWFQKQQSQQQHNCDHVQLYTRQTGEISPTNGGGRGLRSKKTMEVQVISYREDKLNRSFDQGTEVLLYIPSDCHLLLTRRSKSVHRQKKRLNRLSN